MMPVSKTSRPIQQQHKLVIIWSRRKVVDSVISKELNLGSDVKICKIKLTKLTFPPVQHFNSNLLNIHRTLFTKKPCLVRLDWVLTICKFFFRSQSVRGN